MSPEVTGVDQLARQTAALIKPLLEAGGLAGAVFDSVVTGMRPARYAVFNLARVIGSGRLTSVDEQADWLLTVQAIGGADRDDPNAIDHAVDQARWVQAVAIRQLLGTRIHPPGWTSTPVRHADGQPVDWDTSATPPLAYAVDSFRWKSDKQ